MNRKKIALGKGLDAIIKKGKTSAAAESQNLEAQPVDTEKRSDHETDSSKPKQHADGDLVYLPVEYLQRGRYQPRRDIDPDSLNSLCDSIKTQGVMQPIVIRKIKDNRYEIIAGERRWRASQLAGLEKVPCILREVDDQSTIALSLIENIQREDLTPIEEAIALQRLQQEFDLTHQQVADAVGKSRAAVSNLIRLLGLTDDVKRMLDTGDLEMGHARALLTLPEHKQTEAARTVVLKDLTVRQTESYVKKLILEEDAGEQNSRAYIQDPNIEQLENKVSLKVGAPVKIQHTRSGKGKLILQYNSLEELDGILEHIQ